MAASPSPSSTGKQASARLSLQGAKEVFFKDLRSKEKIGFVPRAFKKIQICEIT